MCFQERKQDKKKTCAGLWGHILSCCREEWGTAWKEVVRDVCDQGKSTIKAQRKNIEIACSDPIPKTVNKALFPVISWIVHKESVLMSMKMWLFSALWLMPAVHTHTPAYLCMWKCSWPYWCSSVQRVFKKCSKSRSLHDFKNLLFGLLNWQNTGPDLVHVYGLFTIHVFHCTWTFTI